MNTTFLYCAGALGILVSIAHGYIGDRKLIAPLENIHPSGKRVLRAIVFLSAVYWFLAGVALLIAPTQFSPDVAKFAVYLAAFIFASSSLANLWATRGRHFGWVLLAVATGLTLLGAP
ncbi:MAG: hypothetical protein ACPGVT_06665 [Maricaulaceae bacterium]